MTRSKVYSLFQSALSKGTIKRGRICENCGFNNGVDAHHEDYSRPLVVTWLCRCCHSQLHRMKKPWGPVGRKNRARVEKLFFRRLDEARIAREHSVVDAVKELGISHSLWYAWKKGGIARPMRVYVDAIEKYIKEANANQ